MEPPATFFRGDTSSLQRRAALTGAPNDGFLLNALKTRFRLSRVFLDLYRNAV